MNAPATPVRDAIRPHPGLVVPGHVFADVALFLGLVSGCVVMFEPAPYDAVLGLTALLAFLMGMRLPRAIAPLVVLMLLFQIGGLLALTVPIPFPPVITDEERDTLGDFVTFNGQWDVPPHGNVGPLPPPAPNPDAEDRVILPQ